MVMMIAKSMVILFGIYFIITGIFMFTIPEIVRGILRKAGSTNFINYAEITIRLIPAISLIIYSDLARYPLPFFILGWFMVATSIFLYCIPRKWHHLFSIKSAEILKPVYFQIISPFSILTGLAIIYNTF